MQANELRIGNKVNTFFNIGTILTIELKECIIEFKTGKKDRYTFDELKGIELTEEILLKAGFIVKNKEWSVAALNIYFSIHNKFDDWRFTPIWCKDYKPIRYVHELQNLYFALTGEEIEINEL